MRLPLLVSAPPQISVVRRLASELLLDPEQTEKALWLFSRDLPPLADSRCIPFLFGVSPKLIGSMETSPQKHYREFNVQKWDGSTRTISSPRRFLKLIQYWISDVIVRALPVSTHAHGFVKDRSIFTNAAVHQGRRYVLSVDLKDFFPSVKSERVATMMTMLGFPPRTAHQLARLTTFRGHLPQGAPTSPGLANAAFKDVDDKIAQLSGKWNATYTRYADDLTFSGSRSFSRSSILELAMVLEASGFSLNHAKTRFMGAGVRQEVTGLTVNQTPRASREYRRLLRAIVHRATTSPKEFVVRKHEILGKLSHIEQGDRELGIRLRQRFLDALQLGSEE